MNFLSLFSGINGFDLAAYNAGIRCENHYFSEVDPYAISVTRKRFPDAIPLGDVGKIRYDELPAGEWLVCGKAPYLFFFGRPPFETSFIASSANSGYRA
jgi:site-specific DNA-cytosine methylase